MSGRLAGVLLGGGAVGAYYNGLDVSGTLRHLMVSPWQTRDFPVWQGTNSQDPYSASIRAVQTQLEQMRYDMHRQNGVHISMADKQGAGSAVVTVGLSTGGALLLYLRLVRGWKLSDFLYVSRASLDKTMDAMNRGVEGVTQRLLEVKGQIDEKVRGLRQKQDETIEAQERLKLHMEAVGRDVEAVGRDVADTRDGVQNVHRKLEGIHTDMQDRLLRATDGVEILAKVVYSLMQGNAGSRTHAKHDLENFLKSSSNSVEGSNRPALGGLESLMEGRPSAVGRLEGPQHAHSVPIQRTFSMNLWGATRNTAQPSKPLYSDDSAMEGSLQPPDSTQPLD